MRIFRRGLAKRVMIRLRRRERREMTLLLYYLVEELKRQEQEAFTRSFKIMNNAFTCQIVRITVERAFDMGDYEMMHVFAGFLGDRFSYDAVWQSLNALRTENKQSGAADLDERHVAIAHDVLEAFKQHEHKTYFTRSVMVSAMLGFAFSRPDDAPRIIWFIAERGITDVDELRTALDTTRSVPTPLIAGAL